MPVDWSKYPKDWKSIALKVKQDADWTCQQCGRQCKRSDESWIDFEKRGGLANETEGKRTRYVLTVAHINHDPENPHAELKALCSVCHLRHDAPMKAAKRRKQLSLF